MPEYPYAVKNLRWHEPVIAAISGILLALAFPGSDWSLLAWVALVPFALVVFKPRRKRVMMGLFAAFGAGFYLTLLYWFLWMHPLTWLGFTELQSRAITVGAWVGATFLLMLQLVLFGWFYGWLTQAWGRPGWKHVLSLALGWTAVEWLSSLGAFGFTWGNLALTQYQTLPMLQIIDVVGSFPLAGLIVGVNGAIALALFGQYASGFSPAHWKPVGVALVPVVGALAYGAVRLADPLPETSFSVAIVQGNIAGGDKFDKGPGAIDRTVDKYMGLTEKHRETDMVLWPETALPVWFRSQPDVIARMQRSAIADSRFLMTGTLDWKGNPGNPDFRAFNAVTVVGPTGENMGFDYKRHLVPFGEYLPGRDLLPEPLAGFVAGINILALDFSPGLDPHIFQLPFAKIGAGVCYDGIFPDAIRPAVLNGAEVLALVTNDAWYKDTTAPRVLNAHAVLRAVETKRWVLRAANTGISSIITPQGNITGQTPVYEDATLVGRAAPMRELTLYTRFGDWASGLAFVGMIGFGYIRWTNRKQNRAL